MSGFSDVGNLMHLYLDEIEPGEGTDASPFLIKASANVLSENGGRNWIPVIVQETGKDRYRVISNSFIYAVAEAANLERVWCIIADRSDEAVKTTKVLAREAFPQINLSIASRDDIHAALDYLSKQPNSALKSVKLPVAVNRIEEADRQYWQDLSPIAALKCGITKGKKLDALKQVFYLTPQLPLVATPDPDLKKMTATELKKIAKERGLEGYSKLKKADLVKLLS